MTLRNSKEVQGQNVGITMIGQTGAYAYPYGGGAIEEIL